MATVESEVLQLGPDSNGTLLSPWEFDAGDFEEGWRYELVNGVLIVNPPPLLAERDPNEQLGHWLRTYQESHANGSSLDLTVSEQTVKIGPHRRRVDRAVWAGLGRLPEKDETPTVCVEFVSEGTRNRQRDYDVKRDVPASEAGKAANFLRYDFQAAKHSFHARLPLRSDVHRCEDGSPLAKDRAGQDRLRRCARADRPARAGRQW